MRAKDEVLWLNPPLSCQKYYDKHFTTFYIFLDEWRLEQGKWK